MTARTFSRQVNVYRSHSVRENQRTQAFCAYATFIHEAPVVSRILQTTQLVHLHPMLSHYQDNAHAIYSEGKNVDPLGPVFQNDPTGLILLDWIKS